MPKKKNGEGLDAYETEIEAGLVRDGVKSVRGTARRKTESVTRQAAAAALRKEARINIRISSTDLMMLKQRAAREGLPYQTMIAGILHKVASGLGVKPQE